MFKPKSILWILIASLPLASYAEIYKTVDENGNIIFTDAPGDKPAEEVELKPSTIISPPPLKTAPPSEGSSREESFTYSSLTIKKPADGTTIDKNGDLTVLAAISPKLRPADKLQLFVDGKAVSGPQKGLSFKAGNLARGPHTIDVRALSSDGKVLNSASVTVFSHRPSGIKSSAPTSGSPSLATQAPHAPTAPTATRAPNAPTKPPTP
ncbi:DUF4124 domain-containing protein [Spartinivicinus ruber]|uniref:DUF4124 domain-containing protein n=1 Tax=Spartinivicinus ruber TaxID=2683272 RepID=UPI0013D0200F|nr:DUF4124 domain-containing protein [Spartinivicinus ruber]